MKWSVLHCVFDGTVFPWVLGFICFAREEHTMLFIRSGRFKRRAMLGLVCTNEPKNGCSSLTKWNADCAIIQSNHQLLGSQFWRYQPDIIAVRWSEPIEASDFLTSQNQSDSHRNDKLGINSPSKNCLFSSFAICWTVTNSISAYVFTHYATSSHLWIIIFIEQNFQVPKMKCLIN